MTGLTIGAKLRTLTMTAGLLSLTPAVGHTQTIEDAVRQAISNHPSIAAAGSVLLQSEHAIDQARAGWRPKVDITVDSGYSRVNSVGTRNRASRPPDGSGHVENWANAFNFTANQTILDFGRTDGDVDAAMQLRNSSSHLLDSTRADVALRAATAYLQLVRAQNLMFLVEEYVDWHDNVLEKTGLNVLSGISTKTEEATVQAKQHQAENRAIQFEGLYRDAVARYIEAVGEEPGELEDPEIDQDIDFDEGVEGLMEQMLLVAPSLRASQAVVESLRAQHEGRKSAYFPTLSGELQYNREKDVDGVQGVKYDAAATLKFAWNLYNGGGDEAAIRSAAAEVDAALNREGDEKRRLEQNLRLAWNRFVTARDQIEFTEGQVDAAINVFFGRQTEFDIDRAKFVEVLNARNQQFDAEVALVNLVNEYTVAYYALSALTGNLYAALGVEAPRVMRLDADGRMVIGDDSDEGQPLPQSWPAIQDEPATDENGEEDALSEEAGSVEDGDDDINMMFDMKAPEDKE